MSPNNPLSLSSSPLLAQTKLGGGFGRKNDSNSENSTPSTKPEPTPKSFNRTKLGGGFGTKVTPTPKETPTPRETPTGGIKTTPMINPDKGSWNDPWAIGGGVTFVLGTLLSIAALRNRNSRGMGLFNSMNRQRTRMAAGYSLNLAEQQAGRAFTSAERYTHLRNFVNPNRYTVNPQRGLILARNELGSLSADDAKNYLNYRGQTVGSNHTTALDFVKQNRVSSTSTASPNNISLPLDNLNNSTTTPTNTTFAMPIEKQSLEGLRQARIELGDLTPNEVNTYFQFRGQQVNNSHEAAINGIKVQRKALASKHKGFKNSEPVRPIGSLFAQNYKQATQIDNATASLDELNRKKQMLLDLHEESIRIGNQPMTRDTTEGLTRVPYETRVDERVPRAFNKMQPKIQKQIDDVNLAINREENIAFIDYLAVKRPEFAAKAAQLKLNPKDLEAVQKGQILLVYDAALGIDVGKIRQDIKVHLGTDITPQQDEQIRAIMKADRSKTLADAAKELNLLPSEYIPNKIIGGSGKDTSVNKTNPLNPNIISYDNELKIRGELETTYGLMSDSDKFIFNAACSQPGSTPESVREAFIKHKAVTTTRTIAPDDQRLIKKLENRYNAGQPLLPGDLEFLNIELNKPGITHQSVREALAKHRSKGSSSSVNTSSQSNINEAAATKQAEQAILDGINFSSPTIGQDVRTAIAELKKLGWTEQQIVKQFANMSDSRMPFGQAQLVRIFENS